ncbi:kinesin-like protein KIN-12F [Malania oleifera]|uniref:kinesin-like protein KIN-12F n=1 Tax=Malania oleifera TaxID=397392 RepID=UPI0025AE8166|nr:kinesin-like protein KIN-12F [Malania oleifera]
MLRDFKFLRRNSGNNPPTEEVENVPLNPRDSSVVHMGADAPRAPLNTIQDPTQKPKLAQEQESGLLRTRVERTPSKAKGKSSDAAFPIRTPEKHGRSRFGWGQKNEPPSSNVTEDGRIDATNTLIQSSRGNGSFHNMTPRSTTRAVGRGSSSYSESNSTQSTPTKSVTKPPNPGFSLASGSRLPANGGGARVGGFAALSKGIPISCGPSTIINTVEVPHFDLKEDPSFWMDHNVQVLIRVRPLNAMEKSMTGYSRCLKQESAQSITWISQPETRFTFDHVACESIDQETLFRLAGLSMVENCLSGYNSCMFAYGQTGSGKTYTMLGEIEELEVKPSPNRGMTPRIFEFLFARIRAEEESRRDERLKYSCKCSFLEIYNEQITDLLDPSSTNLLLREDIKKGVYVENLSEIEVWTVSDILRLLAQGSSNRKVAATNMNRESSRSHSVFTCVIESKWEKDATTNLRFARLNLVDLAGSERQKTSGAEGERLKEAANINKSLSTLGHVIMVLVDVAHGKPKHIPYRDSRLTFLLQDSLGGNSKTMIIANVSPSICCAAETLNTLKFAQRAKLIQNNAVVNEDSSGDVVALQHQIRLLKEELSALRRQNVSRSLSFGSSIAADITQAHERVRNEEELEMYQQRNDDLLGPESKCAMRVSSKQLKSLETTLAGALRREQMAENSIKQLEAEIEQQNRLVRQREEDTRCTKMMLKFREDKIQRMESLLGGLIPADTYLLGENKALCEEIQLLRAKIDRNPEVTRFALENIKLLDQLRRFQDFYEEGEREILLAEVSQLRDQLLQNLDGVKNYNHPNLNATPQEAIFTSKEKDSLQLELKNTLGELDECRINLHSCLKDNAKLSREIDDLRSLLNNVKSECNDGDGSMKFMKESSLETSSFEPHFLKEVKEDKAEGSHETLLKHTEEFVHLQLELDILKMILKEESVVRGKIEEKAMCFTSDLEIAKDKVSQIAKECDDLKGELKEAKSIIEAFESQQILSINEMDDLRNSKNNYVELLSKKELEIISLKEKLCCQKLQDQPPLKHSERYDSPLQEKLKRMHDSLEKAKRMNMWYQNDRAFQASNEEEMDEVRKQAEAETAEVIICLQEELIILQQQVEDSNFKEMESKNCMTVLETELKELQEKLHVMTKENVRLGEMLEEKNMELRIVSEEWGKLTGEIEEVLADGSDALKDASDQLDSISCSFPQRRTWISDQFGKTIKIIYEKELLIEELSRCLENANSRKSEVECMLRSLKGAAMVITEAHQQDCSEKEREILLLRSELSEKASTIKKLGNRLKLGEDCSTKASICATVAFVIVSRFSEMNANHLKQLKDKDFQLSELVEVNLRKDALLDDQAVMIEEAETQIQSLRMELETLEENCGKLRQQLLEEQKRVCAMEQKLEAIEENDVLKTREKLVELKTEISSLLSCMSKRVEVVGSTEKRDAPRSYDCTSSVTGMCETGTETNQDANNIHSHLIEDLKPDKLGCSLRVGKSMCQSRQMCKGTSDVDLTVLLREEIESTIESFKVVQNQISKLCNEKEDAFITEKQSQESMKCLMSEALSLQRAMSSFEKLFGLKIMDMDHKLQAVELVVHKVGVDWCQVKELLELEVGDAKIIANQGAAEASCILGKFEEAQEMMKEADVMINKLLIANEMLKIEVEGLRKKEVTLINEKEILITKVESLQSSNDLKDQQCEELEKQLITNLTDTRDLVVELEGTTAEVQEAFKKDFMFMTGEFCCIKSRLLESTKSLRSGLEDIWSELIVKDCAVSALHLCHMGILLETVTGLNAENGLLHHGLCESHSVIADLRQRNVKSRKELEMCRILKGKLLADIKNSFDRISRKEDETGELGIKLNAFEKKIMDLQLQEELMLQRSNSMGSELAILIKELDLSNSNVLASLVNQEKLLKDKEEIIKSQTELFVIDLFRKDFESLIMASELKELALRNSEKESMQVHFSAVLGNLMKEIIFLNLDAGLKEQFLIDKEGEVALLQDEIEEVQKERQDLLLNLNQSSLKIKQMDEMKKVLENDMQLLKSAASSNELLKGELGEVVEANVRLSNQVHNLEFEHEKLVEELRLKEKDLEFSCSHVSVLDVQNEKLQKDICLLEASFCRLQDEVGMKNAELSRMSCLEIENKSLMDDIKKLKSENCIILQDLEAKRSELESSLRHINAFGMDKQNLEDKVSSMEVSIANLQTDLDRGNAELAELQDHHSIITEQLFLKSQDLDVHVNKVNALMEENVFLNSELRSHVKNKHEVLTMLSANIMKSVDAVESVDMVTGRMFNMLNEQNTMILDRMLKEISENLERTSKFIEELKCLEDLSEELMSENSWLQSELLRKDDVLRGLSFDLRLLQESASNAKDQKDEIEDMAASLEALEDELTVRSGELEEAVAHGKNLEIQLQEKMDIISSLRLEISKNHDSLDSLSRENFELRAHFEEALAAKSCFQDELTEKRKINDSLEMELLEMGSSIEQMSNSIESMKSNLSMVTSERDQLQEEILILRKELEATGVLAEENEANILEAQQMAEARRIYAEEKEEEVKLLERSVEELECTINVLENKVDIVKGEAERQRLQREELESELHAIKHQMESVESGDADMKRILHEKEKNVQEALDRIQLLEGEIACRDAEISQCKAHISELSLHAEAQANEYKLKFKALEIMAEQVRPEGSSTHVTNSLSIKSEKNATKSRGSGSPFKCIGLGLAHQIKSEKDEELTAGRVRIEELEALAAHRQKEIFMLNARLAAAESMTHDVIRDLLGVKLDMTNYASLLDNQQVKKITDKALIHCTEAQVKEQEVNKLKQQLNEFIEERQGWLEEIDRKQAEMVALQISLEKLRQQDRLLLTENEMFKMENINHKKKVMELESEVKKLCGQQNLQQRIHHHAKIKEENNLLKIQNEDLSAKLKRAETILSRVKEELARYRAANGRCPYIDLDEEQRLNNKLKETEEERLQLAQKLLALCTSILKAAGITKPVSDVSLPVAEEALEQLKNRITLLEQELQDLKFKNIMTGERIRLSESMPQPSPLSSRSYDNHQTSKRGSQTPFLSALDR